LLYDVYYAVLLPAVAATMAIIFFSLLLLPFALIRRHFFFATIFDY